jgi:hypothetical protein
MNPEVARNQNYDNDYANDSKNVHSALLPLHDDGSLCSAAMSRAVLPS